MPLRMLIVFVVLAGICSAQPANTLTITEIGGVTTPNYPVQFGRPFVQGEIAQFPQAKINGVAVATQADVKQRWPDGSVKHAMISFYVPSLAANSTITISFQNQSSGNNTPLSVAQMLGGGFNFDAQIQLTNGSTVGAEANCF